MISARFRVPLLVASIISLLVLYFFLLYDGDKYAGKLLFDPPEETTGRAVWKEESDCPYLPGIDDVQVIMKTGATEALEKVPVHFHTTLKCIPHFVVFSDFEEDLAGVHTIDVLRTVDENIKQTNPEFDLYNRLRASGRKGLHESDINNDPSTPSGKPENPGWKLDKWKFLPMMNETLHVRDDAKWYVFMEADTYISWPNLLDWLEKFDSSVPYYLGTQMMVGDMVFAHGGSGYVISRAAMQKFAEYRAPRVAELDEFTASQWAGDCVLGKVLSDAGVGLFYSQPMIQGATPWAYNYFDHDKQYWCTPVITYHHMTPEDVRDTWAFERRWRIETRKPILLHSDVFDGLIQRELEQLSKIQEDWDNESSDEHQGETRSIEDCEAHCVDDKECVQYSYQPGRCWKSKSAKRGSRKPDTTSGWLPGRINKTVTKLGSCKKMEWITP
ncbi:hypothetical protein BDV25DRAFT_153953 [Aspergillus avenaceus]|uniref:N-acetylgalactosaminide beta-1,3-galactosyltransferase n=1 Tax=Aspergillus avenaceus TaxID=36643 RepID=A0A5N6TWL0_ASPAV|nr:hypothetical protein BDV25DRAFT_153953 [Aspergillus avenaceus]